MRRLPINVLIFMLVLTGIGRAQTTPVLFYSDLPTGMCTGGLNNKGHIVTVNGNNFGDSQDSRHFVKLGATTLDSYLLWTNKKIAFQLGTAAGCVADGDYNISVATPAGTSNALPMHIYRGATIYFVDTKTGNDRWDGTQPDHSRGGNIGPFKSYSTCRAKVALAPGNTCYFMPGSQDFGNGPNDGYAYLYISGVNGTRDKYSAFIGYPTTDTDQMAKVGCANGPYDGCKLYGTTGGKYWDRTGIKLDRSSYVVVANLRVYYYSEYGGNAQTPGALDFGAVGSGSVVLYPWHHVRVVNNDISGSGWQVADTYGFGSFLKIYGNRYHDIDNNFASKHTGGLYLGTNTHDYDIGWINVDFSCAVAGTCHTNKQIEVHSTKALQPMPAPTLGVLSATSGGSLTAGTYDVYVSYRSHQWYGNWVPDPPNCYAQGTCNSLPTETDHSTVQKITIDGTTQTSITVNAPAGYNSIPGLGINSATLGMKGDGVSTICNPALAYRVFVCKETSGTCVDAAMKLHGESTYKYLASPGVSTASNFTISSLKTDSPPYQTPTPIWKGTPPKGGLYQTDLTGCNIYNIEVHDSKFINAPGYAWTLFDLGTEEGYVRFYNNEVINSGNNANWLQGGDDYPFGCSTSVNIGDPYYDSDSRYAAEGGKLEFYNNTFYNSGKPYAGMNGICGSSVLTAGWSRSDYPTLNLIFRNNILVQPQSGQHFYDPAAKRPATNLVIRGDHNVCYGYMGMDCRSPVDFNGDGGAQHSDPSFTANGSLVTPAKGNSPPGQVYVGYDAKPRSGSPAIDSGTDTTSLGVGHDIRGVRRPQGRSVDIGPYEQ